MKPQLVYESLMYVCSSVALVGHANRVCAHTCLPSLPNSDLLQNPLIVPVKVLRGHQVVNKIGRWMYIHMVTRHCPTPHATNPYSGCVWHMY